MISLFLLILFPEQIIAVCLYVVKVVWRICLPFLFVGILAYFLFPIVRKLESFGVKRSVAVILIYVWIISLISLSTYFIYPYFILQLDTLFNRLPIIFTKFEQLLMTFHTKTESFPQILHDQIDELFQMIALLFEEKIEKILNRLTNVVDIVILMTITPIILFYVLKDGPKWKHVIRTYVEGNHYRSILPLGRLAHQYIGKYIYGQLIVICIVTLLLFFGYALFDIPYAFLFALFGGIMNIIPYIGPLIGFIPVMIASMLMSWHTFFLISLFTLVVQVMEGVFISPFVIGKSVQLHPLTVIVVVLIGAEIGGLVGMLLLVPVFSITKTLYQASREDK